MSINYNYKIPKTQLTSLGNMQWLGEESAFSNNEHYESDNAHLPLRQRIAVGQWKLNHIPKNIMESKNDKSINLFHLSEFKLPKATKVGDYISTSKTSWHHTHPRWWYFNKESYRKKGAHGYIKTIIPIHILEQYGVKSKFSCTDSNGLYTPLLFKNDKKSNIQCTQTYILPPFIGQVSRRFKIQKPEGTFGTTERKDPIVLNWSENKGITGVELKWKMWRKGLNSTRNRLYSNDVLGTIRQPPIPLLAKREIEKSGRALSTLTVKSKGISKSKLKSNSKLNSKSQPKSKPKSKPT